MAVYAGDPFAYDFEGALEKSLKSKRSTYQRRRDQKQREADDRYVELFAEGRLRRPTTYGYGYPIPYRDLEYATAQYVNVGAGTPEPEGEIPRETVPFKSKEWERIRNAVLRRDRYSCQRCGLAGKANLTVHHMLPRSEGGGDQTSNLISLCACCHDFVEIQEPPLRNREQIVGSSEETDDYKLHLIREEIASWAGRRKRHDLIATLANRLTELGVMPKRLPMRSASLTGCSGGRGIALE